MEDSLDNGSSRTTTRNAFPSSLPPEILVNIFSFFSKKDLLLCARVNQAWHHVVTSFYIWRTIKFNEFETFSRFHEVLQLIANTRRNLNAYLNVIENSTSELSTSTSFEKPTYFYSTKLYGHFVRQLDLSGINRKCLVTEEMLCDLFPNTPNLEIVNFYNCYEVTDKVIEKLTKSCHHLKKLKLFGCTSLTNRSLHWIEMRCPELTSLNIGFCTVITSNALQSLVSRCKELTSLTISYCSNAPAISLIPMTPRLRKLDLGCSSPKLTDETAEILSQRCPNLVHLSLSFSLITSRGLIKIAQGCKKLSFIDLNGCHNIYDKIPNLLYLCNELKTIQLNYLFQISGKAFSSIVRSNHIEYASFTRSKILEVTSTDLPSDDENFHSRIKKLILSECEISTKNLEQIAYLCKNLEYLDVSSVCDIDDEILQFLCDHLKNLEEVIAGNCHKVSIAMQDKLSNHQKIKFAF